MLNPDRDHRIQSAIPIDVTQGDPAIIAPADIVPSRDMPVPIVEPHFIRGVPDGGVRHKSIDVAIAVQIAKRNVDTALSAKDLVGSRKKSAAVVQPHSVSGSEPRADSRPRYIIDDERVDVTVAVQISKRHAFA